MRTRLTLLVGAVVASMLALAAPASAIAFGHPDGMRQPSGGMLVVDWLDANDELGTDGVVEPFCSLTLIAPRVAVTAAHCVDFLELASPGASSRPVGVTFAPRWRPGTKLSFGRLFVSPYTDQGDDLAAVVFREPVNVEPADLPPLHLLDRLAAHHALTGMLVQSVGYGSYEPQFDADGNPLFEFPRIPGVRQVATSAVTTLAEHTFDYDQNPEHGYGGGCSGDSGGGVFKGDTVLGVMTDGDELCRDYGVNVRLDTPSALAFLTGLIS